MIFWDSSGILPLLIAKPSSRLIRDFYKENTEITIWVLTPVEVTSALCRMVRMNQLTLEGSKTASEVFQNLGPYLSLIENIETIKQKAMRLLHLHPLKAADSLQLAAALAATLDNPWTHTFVSLDNTLRTAASKEGFEVFPDIIPARK